MDYVITLFINFINERSIYIFLQSRWRKIWISRGPPGSDEIRVLPELSRYSAHTRRRERIRLADVFGGFFLAKYGLKLLLYIAAYRYRFFETSSISHGPKLQDCALERALFVSLSFTSTNGRRFQKHTNYNWPSRYIVWKIIPWIGKDVVVHYSRDWSGRTNIIYKLILKYLSFLQ